MKYPNGHEFEHRMLLPSQLKVDRTYQRPLEQARVNRIVKEFDGDIFNEPKVSYRDGQLWIFNGQHSIAAWRIVHDGKDEPLDCKVYKGMTWLEECEAFIKQNGFDKDVTINEKLAAGLNARKPEVVDMVDKAKLAGFVVDFSQSKTPTRIVATSTLLRAYNQLGGDDYLDMLTAISEAWYGDMDAISTQILSGMTAFYRTYGGKFKREDLVNSLKRVQPFEIIRNGKAAAIKKNGYARQIVDTYNHRRRYRLDGTLLG